VLNPFELRGHLPPVAIYPLRSILEGAPEGIGLVTTGRRGPWQDRGAFRYGRGRYVVPEDVAAWLERAVARHVSDPPPRLARPRGRRQAAS
jgi:hypothetical protein